MKAYGREAKAIDVARAVKYANKKKKKPYIGSIWTVRAIINKGGHEGKLNWYWRYGDEESWV
jgi:hypothetical protein